MATLANVLKKEIRRLARLEARDLLKSVNEQNRKLRESNRELKARMKELEKKVKAVESGKPAVAAAAKGEAGEDMESIRFSGKGVRSLRKKFKMTRAEFALLTGVTQASVYNWEKKDSVLRRLRGDTKEALASLRGIGAREARARLESLSA